MITGRPPLPRNAAEPAPVAGARWVPLTRGHFALVDEEDYAALAAINWYYSHGYADREDRDGSVLRMHRLIIGAQPGQTVDHINGNRLDNRRANLRICTAAENCRNSTPRRKNSTSGYKGVSFNKFTGRYQAYIVKDGRNHFLGRFDKASDAAAAYNKAAVELHGEFARLNETGG